MKFLPIWLKWLLPLIALAALSLYAAWLFLPQGSGIGKVLAVLSHPSQPGLSLDQRVGLEGRLDHFPAQLSGGEQQRVWIARAVAKRPVVMLCDEPTGALDSATGVRVLEALATVNREMGTTTVIITHNADIAKMAQRVLWMQDGQIVREAVNERPLAASELEW